MHDLAAVYLVDGTCEVCVAHRCSLTAEKTSSFVDLVVKALGPVKALGQPSSQNVIVARTQASRRSFVSSSKSQDERGRLEYLQWMIHQ